MAGCSPIAHSNMLPVRVDPKRKEDQPDNRSQQPLSGGFCRRAATLMSENCYPQGEGVRLRHVRDASPRVPNRRGAILAALPYPALCVQRGVGDTTDAELIPPGRPSLWSRLVRLRERVSDSTPHRPAYVWCAPRARYLLARDAPGRL